MEMNPELFVVLYCKTTLENGARNAEFVRAYKYINPVIDKTPTCQHFLYSHKAKRYVIANIYICNWKGSQSEQIEISRDIFRWSLRRIGLDIR